MKYLTRKIRKTRNNSINKKHRRNKTQKLKGGLNLKQIVPVLFATVAVAFRPLNNRHTRIDLDQNSLTTTPRALLSAGEFDKNTINELEDKLSRYWPTEVSVSTIGVGGGGGLPPSDNIKVVMSDPNNPNDKNKNQEKEVTTAEMMELVGIKHQNLLKNYFKDIIKTEKRRQFLEKIKILADQNSKPTSS
jgi:hypothetical protein